MAAINIRQKGKFVTPLLLKVRIAELENKLLDYYEVTMRQQDVIETQSKIIKELQDEQKTKKFY